MTTQFCLFTSSYNTGSGISRLLEGLADLEALLTRRDIQLRGLLIDDASTDGTGRKLDDFARKHEFAEVRHNETNRGNAANILSGYQWALDNAGDDGFVACCDSDGEHNPAGFANHLDLLALGHFNGVAGTIIYPQHHPNWTDLNMMRFAGSIQADAAKADQPFYIQSPGWQLHRSSPLRRVIEHLLPAYMSYYEVNVGEFPRWGMHGVIDHLLAKSGAKLHSAYLECFGQAPNRNADKLHLQAKACLSHLEVVERFWAEGAKTFPASVSLFPSSRPSSKPQRPPYVTRWNGPGQPLADHGLFAVKPVAMRRQASERGKRLLSKDGEFQAVVYDKRQCGIGLFQWLKLARRLVSIVTAEYGSAVVELSTAIIPVEREYLESQWPWYEWHAGYPNNDLHYSAQKMWDQMMPSIPGLLTISPVSDCVSDDERVRLEHSGEQPHTLYFASDAGKNGRLGSLLARQMFYARGTAPSFTLGVSGDIESHRLGNLRDYEIEELNWRLGNFTADDYGRWKRDCAVTLADCP